MRITYQNMYQNLQMEWYLWYSKFACPDFQQKLKRWINIFFSNFGKFFLILFLLCYLQLEIAHFLPYFRFRKNPVQYISWSSPHMKTRSNSFIDFLLKWNKLCLRRTTPLKRKRKLLSRKLTFNIWNNANF